MADYKIAKLIRNLYKSTISKTNNSKDWQDFSSRIKYIIKSKFSSENYSVFIDDIANQVLMNLFTSFTLHQFWSEITEDNEQNNKIEIRAAPINIVRRKLSIIIDSKRTRVKKIVFK